jgi:hypothetical protein
VGYKGILCMDMKEGQDPELFITILEYNWYRMEERGLKITNTQLKIHILNNLLVEYDVAVNLLTRTEVVMLEELRVDLWYE